ncbi:unnamed protein product [Arabidopsis lyrata]|nr:unnamed protein product [Arabidopsis lyrata]
MKLYSGRDVHGNNLFAALVSLVVEAGKRKPEDDLETKPILKKHKETSEEKETMEGFADSLQHTNIISVMEAATTKTLYVANLYRNIKISDIINFFKDVGEVVHVRLIVNSKGCYACWCFVEFASANEAEKNGEYLDDRKIFLEAVKTVPFSPPKYCIEYHKNWYEDYLRQESLLIEEDEAVEGLEEVAARKKILFVANLPEDCQIIPNIIKFFEDVGEVVHVRIIVDHMGEHVDCGFVEFTSSNEAEKAMENNGQYLRYCRIFLGVVEKVSYPLRPKYNLAEKLWYEDYLRRSRHLKTKPNLKKPKVIMANRFILR